MDFSKKNILVLTDGSQGMISQVMGLAKQFSKNISSLQTKLLFPWSKLQPGILPIFSWIFLNEINYSVQPDIIISCGRKSVYLSLFLKNKYKNTINIHIQNPKINFKKFDYIVAPEHDNIKNFNIIKSIGALHKFTQNDLEKIEEKKFDIPKKNLISVIIGGDNKHYKFTLKEINILSLKIKEIKQDNPNYNFLIITSRRTNDEMKKSLRNYLTNIAIFCEEDKNNPYVFALKHSSFFIVSSDSTSMISECAFTSSPIYVFHLPFKRNSKRINQFHQQFEKMNITKKLESQKNLITWSYKPLNESKRIAGIIKERIIKEN